jgi:hypothetical protein
VRGCFKTKKKAKHRTESSYLVKRLPFSTESEESRAVVQPSLGTLLEKAWRNASLFCATFDNKIAGERARETRAARVRGDGLPCRICLTLIHPPKKGVPLLFPVSGSRQPNPTGSPPLLNTPFPPRFLCPRPGTAPDTSPTVRGTDPRGSTSA